jgi:hypothetical protein
MGMNKVFAATCLGIALSYGGLHTTHAADEAPPAVKIDDAAMRAVGATAITFPTTLGNVFFGKTAVPVTFSASYPYGAVATGTKGACARTRYGFAGAVATDPNGACYIEHLRESQEILKDAEIRKNLAFFKITKIDVTLISDVALTEGVRGVLAQCDSDVPPSLSIAGATAALSAFVHKGGRCTAPDRGAVKIALANAVINAKKALDETTKAEISRRLMDAELRKTDPANAKAGAGR